MCATIPLTPALAATPTLTAHTPAAPLATSDTRTGILTLAGGAYAYLPKGLTGAPAPLLVALHGAGGRAADVLEAYRADADAHHFILVLPQSKGPTWDMIVDLQSRLGAEMNVQPRYGRDLKALDAALADLFARVAVDPARVGIMGFSDGATYAISVGTANPVLFRTVIAYSPGPAFPTKFDPTQRIFISHAEEDPVLPYSVTRGLVAKLRVKHMPLMFVPFHGGHEVPKDIHAKAVAYFMGK
ncbi:dienelactone hydrolase family protein [Sphingomonas sp.]|uniref:alpha/beta hydrolase n=1 Tax=Sphingomonas sp. TaxID=28214 RepID=UPI00286BE429|nr:dienelactone hydrolase family protein [Sphingomonas sp.]